MSCFLTRHHTIITLRWCHFSAQKSLWLPILLKIKAKECPYFNLQGLIWSGHPIGSVLLIPNLILFSVPSTLASTLASLVDIQSMLLPQGLCSDCSLWDIFRPGFISKAQSSLLSFRTVLQCLLMILFDLKALPKTASLLPYRSLSYLQTLFFSFFFFFK